MEWHSGGSTLHIIQCCGTTISVLQSLHKIICRTGSEPPCFLLIALVNIVCVFSSDRCISDYAGCDEGLQFSPSDTQIYIVRLSKPDRIFQIVFAPQVINFVDIVPPKCEFFHVVLDFTRAYQVEWSDLKNSDWLTMTNDDDVHLWSEGDNKNQTPPPVTSMAAFIYAASSEKSNE